MKLIEAHYVAEAISKTAVSAGIMCDIMENLQRLFPEFEWYVNKTGCSNICVREKK